MVPTLRSKRLILRAHREEDLAPCHAIWDDEATVAHITRRRLSLSEVWQRILQYQGLWSLLGYGYWAVEDAETGDYLGQLGFARLHRPLPAEYAQIAEAGWVISRSAWGQGLATEGMLAALAWFDVHHRDQPTFCFMDCDHTASQRVASKCGYQAQSTVTFNEGEVLIMRREAGGQR